MTSNRIVSLVGVLLILVCILLSGCSSGGVTSDSTSIQGRDSTKSSSTGTNTLSIPRATINKTETSTPSTPSTPSLQSTKSNSSKSTSTSIPSATSGKSQAVTSSTKSISSEDFDVYYKEIILNEKTSLEELSTKLKFIPVEEDNENTMIRAAGFNNGMDYCWYRFSYPNKEHEEISFDYLYNATLKSGRIVFADLKNIPTKRGVAVGDTLNKLKLAYGSSFVSNYNSETTNYIDFTSNVNTLNFIYEKSTGKILNIHVDYDSNKAMEEMDITGFGD